MAGGGQVAFTWKADFESQDDLELAGGEGCKCVDYKLYGEKICSN